MKITFYSYLLLILFSLNSLFAADPTPPPKTETAVFGLGCFWCSQALFEKFSGVQKVVCGYAGGTVPNPTYEQVSAGTTGHAEVVQITYDPSQITYAQLLDIFWDVHDPTTLDQQGEDVGSNYRSLILYANETQKALAEKAKAAAQKKFSNAIVTQISPLMAFYSAEDYHQNYFKNHPNQPYCTWVISPKLTKLEKHAGDLPPQKKS